MTYHVSIQRPPGSSSYAVLFGAELGPVCLSAMTQFGIDILGRVLIDWET